MMTEPPRPPDSTLDVREFDSAVETFPARLLLDGAEKLANLGSFVWDIVSDRLHWSEQLYRIYGLEPWSVTPTWELFLHSVHPDDRDSVYKAVEGAFRERRSFQGLERIVRPNGEIRILSTRGEVITDGDGDGVRMIGLCQDVTEQSITEQSLRESEARYRTLVEHAPDAIVVLDVDKGRFVDANQKAARLFKLSIPELLSRGPTDLSPARQPDGRRSGEIARLWSEEALEGGTPCFEWSLCTADGKEIMCEVRLVRFPPLDRRLVRGSIVDISDRKRLEAQLSHSQRLESIGRLAGGIAHDFNNLLTAIVGYADMLAEDVPADFPRRQDLDEIRAAGRRAAELTRQLLSFARRQMIEPRVIAINGLILQADRLLRRIIGEHIELVTVLHPDAGAVKIDPGQCEQILINLAVNARDAMPSGGVLTITTEPVDDRAARRVGLAGRYVRLTVSDTGTGMPPDVLAHAFEPFFTTKETGKGTGLGLATCYGIVQQAAGRIWVESEPGQGATIAIMLPLSTEMPEPLEDEGSSAGLDGTETVLVVEDEPQVRGIVLQALRSRGYAVLVAGSGAEALALARGHFGPIDLLISDLVMPKMSGHEVAEVLRAERPTLKVLFMSGYSPDARSHADMQFLPKPFSARGLARKVRQVLDAAG